MSDYFVIALNGLLFILHIFKIIYILFKPSWLKHRMFQFTDDKYLIVGYYLCAMVLMMIMVLSKVGVL